jgi:hypothetical protein
MAVPESMGGIKSPEILLRDLALTDLQPQS